MSTKLVSSCCSKSLHIYCIYIVYIVHIYMYIAPQSTSHCMPKALWLSIKIFPTKKGALKELKHIIIIWYTDAIVTISTCKSLHRHRMARLYTKFNDFASHKSWVHIGCEVILQWRWEHGRGVTNSLGECLCVSQHSHVAKQLFIQLPYSRQYSCHTDAIQLPYSCHIVPYFSRFIKVAL